MYISMLEYIYIDMCTHIHTTLTTHGRGMMLGWFVKIIGKITNQPSPPSPTTISPSGCGSIAACTA